jgi:hypothetical protein
MRLEYTPQTFQRNLGERTQTDVNILPEQRESQLSATSGDARAKIMQKLPLWEKWRVKT